VPAIVVSAHANSDDQTRALAAWYELHVTKLIEPTELVPAVAAVLRRHPRGEVCLERGERLKRLHDPLP
jgi:DNA-binding response OmpR family regulator